MCVFVHDRLRKPRFCLTQPSPTGIRSSPHIRVHFRSIYNRMKALLPKQAKMSYLTIVPYDSRFKAIIQEFTAKERLPNDTVLY